MTDEERRALELLYAADTKLTEAMLLVANRPYIKGNLSVRAGFTLRSLGGLICDLRDAIRDADAEQANDGGDGPRLHNRTKKIVIDRDGTRMVLFPGQDAQPGDTFVCARPHDDGRYDYMCGSEWCRCIS